MSTTDTFSSMLYLTTDALEAASTEQQEHRLRQFDPDVDTEWEDIEGAHVAELVLQSSVARHDIEMAVEAIQAAHAVDAGEGAVFCSVASAYITGIRVGWHSRGALGEAPYLAEWHCLEPQRDEVEEWRRSIFEL